MRDVGPAESGTAAGRLGLDPAVGWSGGAQLALVDVHPTAANRPQVSDYEHRAINVGFRPMRLWSSSVRVHVVAAFALDQGSRRVMCSRRYRLLRPGSPAQSASWTRGPALPVHAQRLSGRLPQRPQPPRDDAAWSRSQPSMPGPEGLRTGPDLDCLRGHVVHLYGRTGQSVVAQRPVSGSAHCSAALNGVVAQSIERWLSSSCVGQIMG